MANNFNQVMLMGRLTTDPKIQYTAQKVSYIRTTIAIDRPSYFANKQASVDFINITMWNQNAEYIGKYAKKGNLVFVVGELRNNNYMNPNTNQQVYRTEVSVNRIDILTPPSNNGSGAKVNNNLGEGYQSKQENSYQSNINNDLHQSTNNTNIILDDDTYVSNDDADMDINWDNPNNI